MLKDSRLRHRRIKEEVDPMSGIFNLADVMLVFACGLMVALVVNWNVDISQNLKSIDLSKSRDVSRTEEFDKQDLTISEENKKYEEMGTVYKDPSTGRMYLITDE